MGVLLLIGGLGTVTVAEDRGVDSGLVATIIAIQPMMMTLWGGIWKTWPKRMEWVGMLIGMAGVVVLMSDSGLSGTWSGTLLVFGACFSWSFGSAISRRIDMPTGLMTTGIEMAAAAIAFMLLLLVILFEELLSFGLDFEGSFILLLLALASLGSSESIWLFESEFLFGS